MPVEDARERVVIFVARAEMGAGAMRAWMDRTNEGLSEMPADGITCRQK